MARLIAYIAVMVSGLAFWTVELLLNYREYSGNNPFSLEDDYQKLLVLNRDHLLYAELFFPLAMLVAFLLLLGFKAFARSVRVALGFVLLICMEFWMWRAFVFDGRIAIYYLRNASRNPVLMLPDHFKQYMVAFGLALVAVLFLREYDSGKDPDDLDLRLMRSLESKERDDLEAPKTEE
jgi:hypothetical protein